MGVGRKEHPTAQRSQGRPKITEHLDEDRENEAGSTRNTEGKESSYLQRQKGLQELWGGPMVQNG